VKQEEESAKNKTWLKMLIMNDEPAGGEMLRKMLAPYGKIDITVKGNDAVEAFKTAFKEGKPYDLICLDMVSERDTKEILKQTRKIEREKGIHSLDGVKIIMLTAAQNRQNNMKTFKSGCEGYLKKPVDEKKLINLLKTLSFDNKALKKSRSKEK
jgi:two-component system chemotaxis response regulator CheY